MSKHVQVPFNTMEGRRKPKTADWLMFLRSAVAYTWYGVGPARPREAFREMIEALQHVLDATADYDPYDSEDTAVNTSRAIRARVVRALFKLERFSWDGVVHLRARVDSHPRFPVALECSPQLLVLRGGALGGVHEDVREESILVHRKLGTNTCF